MDAERIGPAWAAMDLEAVPGRPGRTAVLVLVEGRASDDVVVRAAWSLAAPAARLVLVRVAPPVVNGAPRGPYTDARVPAWELRLALERSTEADLADLAASLGRAGRPVETRVCFGEPVDALGCLADEEEASWVVAASPGRSWLPWSRDRRLARRLGGRIHLVAGDNRALAGQTSPAGPWWASWQRRRA